MRNVFLNVNARSIVHIWQVLRSYFLIGLGALSEMARVVNQNHKMLPLVLLCYQD